LTTASVNSQRYVKFPIHHYDIHFDWEKIEKHVSKLEIDKFIQDHPGDFEAYRQKNNVYSPNIDSLYNDLHCLDLNDDGKTDVIFDGESGGEPRVIEIFINYGSYYKKEFSSMQGIVDLDWQEGRLSRIYIRDWGCCDAYLEFHKIYNVSYDERNHATFSQIYQSVAIYQATLPDSILETPLRFEILNQAYNIRSTPQKDDTSLQYWNNVLDTGARIVPGNSISKLVKGARGMTLAKAIDNSSRE
jgi:hypothetical protein